MGTFGYPMPWCLAEGEEACRRVGWKPYHVRVGYGMDESAITRDGEDQAFRKLGQADGGARL